MHVIDAEVPPGAVRREALGERLEVVRVGLQRRAEDARAAAFETLVAAHRERPFDVLHGLYLVRSGFLAAYAGAFLGRPSVVSARGNDLDRSVFSGEAAAHVLRALDLASCVTAVSRELARKARALAPRARVVVAWNGVDAQAFRPAPPDEALRRRLGLAGRQVVGFAGEARVKKGLVTLLAALALLARERPVSLLLAGGVRADDAGVLAVFRRQQPDLHVVELPYREGGELPPVYALMDVFAHPSLRDGLPNALLEALACGRPVVAARAGGIPDVLRDGREGLLVEPGDAPGLASALGRLLDDPQRAARLGAAGRARVAAAFSPAAEIRRYRRLYSGLRAGARRRPAAGRGRAAR